MKEFCMKDNLKVVTPMFFSLGNNNDKEYKVVNSKRKMYGIGYISAHSYFEHLLNDPELTSVLSED